MPFEITDESSSGDVKLRLSGLDLKELFADAAIGVTSVMTEAGALGANRRIDVELNSDSLEDLLFDWLGEIIYLKDAEQFLPTEVHFKKFEEDSCRISAVLKGDTLDSSRHSIKVDIKAVTYYEFNLTKKNDKWIAEAVLDL